MLYRLGQEGFRLVTKELAQGIRARWELGEIEPYLDDPMRPRELGAFDEAIDELLATSALYDASSDRRTAPAIHRALPLSRLEAADPGLWRYLAVVHRPDWVRHRWELRSFTTMRARFWRPGTRPDSNAYSRLWWIAELTREGDSYDLTERVLTRQPLATPLFVRQFSYYRPAVEAFVDILEHAPADEIEAVVRQFNALLSTVVLEGQERDGLRQWLKRIRAEVAAGPSGGGATHSGASDPPETAGRWQDSDRDDL